MNKIKLSFFFIILSSLFVYLEWGESSKSFLFQAELEVLKKLFTDPMSVLHPFTVIPLLGQIILFVNIINQKINKRLCYIGIGSLGILVLFILFVGCLGLNYKIILSCIPFLAASTYAILLLRRS